MDRLAEYCTAGAALLGVVGGLLRYLMRISTTIQDASTVAAGAVKALDRHVAESDRRHEQLRDRVDEHGQALAVLQNRGSSL
ncbi:hypothetical protein [Kitasatospora sp. NPDC057198]|uniref:hypothetical protein n=1 Tax=Kitasatospora sp. NPDC057198 TaxID=3346046 RepID=UPI0036311D71